MDSKKNIAVLGTGTWGMALARMLSNAGHRVTAWSAIGREIDEFSATRRHPNLPGMVIPDEIVFTKNIEEAIAGSDVVQFSVPSVYVRGTAKAAAPYIQPGMIVTDVAKGLEPETFLTMSEVIRSELDANPALKDTAIVALSGPTHAEEVAIDLPTTIVSASPDTAAAELVQDIYSSSFMRVYTNTDIHGVELCGALKNIIALAAGISAGLGYGDNAKAALITRGMAEMCRIGTAFGCEESTFYGLAGIGDLIVTATGDHSRNNRCGNLIGQGRKPEEAIREVGMVVEGIYAIPAAMALSEKYGIDTPLISAADAIINHGADPRETVNRLMNRRRRAEN